MARFEDEALYGGAAGGGKSDCALAEALRQVEIPYYRGLILRKTYPQLTELMGPLDGDIPARIQKGQVQREQARLDLPQRRENLLRVHAAYQGQGELPGQAL